MDQSDYERLVRRCENEALHGSRSFRVKVVLIGAAAYLVLALFLGTLIALAVAGVDLAREGHLHWAAFKLGMFGLAAAGLALGVLRTLLARIPPPGGRTIKSDEAPRLFELLEKIRGRLKGPPLDRVVVTADFNAAIAQIPRFGLFGGHRNHLVLGLPLLQCLSTVEMTAVLAHEYAHLAEAHGKLGAWVYRQRLTFGALMERLERRDGDFVLDRILIGALERFAPYFNAYTFSLARQHEFEADRWAARVAGTEAVADGLCRVELLGGWLARRYWPGVYALAADHPAPPVLPFRGLQAASAKAYPDWASPAGLAAAREVRSGLDDTHPCLEERLAAIGLRARLPPPVERSAARTLLGSFAARLAEELDAEWWENTRPKWQAHHQRSVSDRTVIARLGAAAAASLTSPELHELANALARQSRAEDARAILEALLARSDGPFPQSRLLYGTLLLEAGDARGLDLLRDAAACDPRLAQECAGRGYEFLCRRLGEREAAVWADGLMSAAPA